MKLDYLTTVLLNVTMIIYYLLADNLLIPLTIWDLASTLMT
ncbi:hypothetical protein AB4401_11545 [Vibrio cyclitrophicus]|nr:hypothetical protein [Vibrio cyclitrophicus]